ncbi:MAG TPA: heme-binding domain-containing protein [Solirubrobacterales bacterium]|nr:heme-binding domain-containing protein [Solirubrobacterales bacterium]
MQPGEEDRRRLWPPSKRMLKRLALGLVALLLVIQVVPYGRSHSNPPVTQAAKWPSGPGQQIAEAGCYDCHSNLTKWRWYSNVAPSSWLVQHDVEDGRAILNFSEWDKPQPDAGELAEKVTSGEMPPLQYKLAHPAARLSSQEEKQLAGAITRLYATDPPPAGGG